VTFTAIVTSHANSAGLLHALKALRTEQTRVPDQIIVLASDTPEIVKFPRSFPGVEFNDVENANDWGHSKRARGIELAVCDWIGFFNDDDSYAPKYIARMLREAPKADVVYCGWNEQPHCEFALGKSTSGNFIVRSTLAKKVGWNDRHYEADGTFIEALKAAGARVVRVDETLFYHNVQ